MPKRSPARTAAPMTCAASVPTMGFIATGKAARAIEQIMLAALKANRPLSADELAKVSEGVVALRAAAAAETSLQDSHQE